MADQRQREQMVQELQEVTRSMERLFEELLAELEPAGRRRLSRWSLTDADRAEALAEARRRFHDAVRGARVSDDPLGYYLNGLTWSVKDQLAKRRRAPRTGSLECTDPATLPGVRPEGRDAVLDAEAREVRQAIRDELLRVLGQGTLRFQLALYDLELGLHSPPPTPTPVIAQIFGVCVRTITRTRREYRESLARDERFGDLFGDLEEA